MVRLALMSGSRLGLLSVLMSVGTVMMNVLQVLRSAGLDEMRRRVVRA